VTVNKSLSIRFLPFRAIHLCMAVATKYFNEIAIHSDASASNVALWNPTIRDHLRRCCQRGIVQHIYDSAIFYARRWYDLQLATCGTQLDSTPALIEPIYALAYCYSLAGSRHRAVNLFNRVILSTPLDQLQNESILFWYRQSVYLWARLTFGFSEVHGPESEASMQRLQQVERILVALMERVPFGANNWATSHEIENPCAWEVSIDVSSFHFVLAQAFQYALLRFVKLDGSHPCL
jgi:hypothetical protein